MLLPIQDPPGDSITLRIKFKLLTMDQEPSGIWPPPLPPLVPCLSVLQLPWFSWCSTHIPSLFMPHAIVLAVPTAWKAFSLELRITYFKYQRALS